MKGNIQCLVFVLSLLQFGFSMDRTNTINNPKTHDKYAAPDPEAPTITQLYAISPCQLEVVWECSSTCHENLDRFKVYWQQKGSQDTLEFSSGIQSNYHDIGELNSDQSYTVWIASVKDDKEYNSDPEDGTTQRGEPIEITGVTAMTQSDTIITVSWNPTKNPCPIKGYSISWNGTSCWDPSLNPTGSHNVSEDTTSYDVAYLTPYSEYDFYVSEITIDGEVGDIYQSSDDSTATTNEGPAGPPESITSSTLDSSSVEVNWTSPYEVNSEEGITGYHISCQLLPDTESLCDITTDEVTFSAIIPGLLDCVDYTFSVQANNIAGLGEAATTKSRTDPKEPPGFISFTYVTITSTSVNLTWELDTNCPVSNYQLDGEEEVLWSEETDSFNIKITPKVNFYLLDYLIPWTSYNLTIKATTEGGTTDSISQTVVTVQDAAGPPAPVNSSVIDSYTVWVSWTSPEKKNGDISGYHISCANGLTSVDDCDVTTENVFSYSIKTLHACGDYNFTVQAINGFGRGEGAETDSSTPPESPPPVTQPKVGDITSNSLNLSFVPPDTTCPILSYDVKGEGDILSNDQIATYSKTFDGGMNTYILDGLTPNTNYKFNITATTDGGTSGAVDFIAQTLVDDSSQSPLFTFFRGLKIMLNKGPKAKIETTTL